MILRARTEVGGKFPFQGTGLQAPSPILQAILFCILLLVPRHLPTLKRRGPAYNLLVPIYTQSSDNLWSLEVLSLCYDSHLFLEVWEIDFSSPDLFSKLQTHIFNCLRAISSVSCLLEISPCMAPLTWIASSLTKPAPPSLPISADGSCIFLIAQGRETLGVILDSCPLPRPPYPIHQQTSLSSASKASLSLLQPWPKAPPFLPQIIIIT